MHAPSGSSLARLFLSLAFVVAVAPIEAQQGTAAQRAQRAAQVRIAAASAGNRVIVGFKPSAAATAGVSADGVTLVGANAVATYAARLSTNHRLQVVEQLSIIPAVVAAVTADADLAGILADPNVEYVEAVLRREIIDRGNFTRVPAPLLETIPWGITKIQAPEGWALSSPANMGAGAKVGIMDTGGDESHPDLSYAGGIWLKNDQTSSSQWADNIVKCGGHGTHVAGTVAARSNTIGVVGVAPEVSLYALKVFETDRNGTGDLATDNCFAYGDVWIKGLQYAVANGIGTVNMSFGGGGSSIAEQNAVTVAANAGLKMVVAAGNGGSGVISYPAGYTGVIAVAATNINDARASFSNYGPHIEVAAPGVGILSTLPGGNYASYQGTSMAAPHVAGLISLMLAKNPSMTITDVRNALRAGAKDLGSPGRDDFFGYGRINALNSLVSALGITLPATALTVARQPSGAAAGEAFTTQPIVQLTSSTGSPVAQSGVPITAAIASGTGGFTGAAVLTATTDSTGKATFSNLGIAATGAFTLRFTSPGLTQAVSASFTVNATAAIVIGNNAVLTGLSGTLQSATHYVLSVPANVTQLNIATLGGSGDVDLLVKRGAFPTPTVADCASTVTGNVEHCSFASPVPGDYYIRLSGFAAYSGVTLTASYQVQAVATALVVSRQPAGAVSGSPFATQPIVQLVDSSGAAVPKAGVVVSAAVSSGPGSLAMVPFEEKGQNRALATILATTDSTGKATFTELTIVGTGAHVLSFAATLGSSIATVASASFTVAAAPSTALISGVPVPNLSGATGASRSFNITVPSGATSLNVSITGGVGDADIFVRRAAEPSFGTFDCRSILVGNEDSCTINAPVAGTYFILLYGYSAFSGVSITATVSTTAGANKLAIDRQPSGAVSGTPLGTQPIVILQDGAGASLATPGIVITAAVTSGIAQPTALTVNGGRTGRARTQEAEPLAVTTATTDATGKATFTALRLVGAGPVTLRFSASGYTSITSASFTVADPTPTAMVNETPVTSLASAQDAVVFYKLTVPAGATALTIKTTGGTGDVDLYVRSGAAPNFTMWDCRPYFDGNIETCSFTQPPAGDYWVMLHGYLAYSGVTLTGTYSLAPVATKLGILRQPAGAVSGSPFATQPMVQLQDPSGVAVSQPGVSVTAALNSGGGTLSGNLTRVSDATGRVEFTDLEVTGEGSHTLTFTSAGLTTATSSAFDVILNVPTALTSGTPLTNRAGAFGSSAFYSIEVPPGASQLKVDISGGTGDADLYVRSGVLPTLSLWDCRPFVNGNVESCTMPSPNVGTWFIMLQGFQGYAGVSIVATVSTGPIPNRLGIVRQPAGAVSGLPFATQPIVELRSAADIPVALPNVPVSAAVSSGPGTMTSVRPRKGAAPTSGHPAPVIPLDIRTIQTDSNGRANFTDLVITGVGLHSISFTSPGLTGSLSATFTVEPPTPTSLVSGVAVTNISGTNPSQRYYTIAVPAGATELLVETVGSVGDADLYVRLGSAPDFENYDCRPYTGSSTESCLTTPPPGSSTIAAGTYYVMIDAYTDYSGLSLKATYTGGSGGATKLAITRQPSGAVSGSPMTTQPIIELRDASNALVAQANVAICAELLTGPGQITELPGSRARPGKPMGVDCATTDASGKATFASLTITGAGSHTIRFHSGSLTPVVSAAITVTQPAPTVLTNAVPIAGIGGAVGTAKYFKLALPAGQSQLTVLMSGGTGDADLYVRKASAPTLTQFDCRPFVGGNDESCTIAAPTAGDYFVMLFGFDDFSGVSLIASHASAAAPITVRLTALDSVTAVAGANLTVPVIVDLSQITAGQDIASLSYNINWNTSRFTYVSHAVGAFGTSTVNAGDVGTGLFRASVISDTGATTTFVAMSLVLKAANTPTVTSTITTGVTGAGNATGANILSTIVAKPLTVCISTGGVWGDVNGDGVVNIIDAAQIARHATGLSVANLTALLAVGDATNDGQVNIIDAQQIARFSVGLSAAVRIGQSAATGCG